MKTMEPCVIKELYEKYGYLIFGRCRLILRSEDDARDALQEVFMKLIENYETIRKKDSVVSWIYTAATNHCFNMLRRQKRFVYEDDWDNVGSRESPEEKISAREIISRIFQGQNKKVRDAVYYTYVEELDQQEIYKITNQSPATIRRNLRRFKDSLPALKKRLLS